MATDQKPIAGIVLDLSGPDGNLYAVLALVDRAMRTHTQGAARMEAIHQWMKEGNGNGEYAQLLAYIHDTHCTIEDLSGEYEFDDPLFDPVSD